MTYDDIVTYLRKKYCPKAILLHGSRARGDAFDQSDYDLALIAENSEQVRTEYFEGYALDISGLSAAESILKAGKTPLWPCVVLFDDADGFGNRLAEQTEKAFRQGPLTLTKEDLEDRRNFLKRLIQRIQGRGKEPLIRSYYLGDFYQRVLRYWCEINQRWTLSVHLLLPLIAKEDPLFYQMIIDLWTEDYQRVVLRIPQHLFKETL